MDQDRARRRPQQRGVVRRLLPCARAGRRVPRRCLDQPAALLDEDAVAVLAGMVGRRQVAGAVLNRTGPVVGLSNLFSTDGAPDEAWTGALAWAAEHLPGQPLVGYESGDELAAARRHGFVPVGPLRVWIQAE